MKRAVFIASSLLLGATLRAESASSASPAPDRHATPAASPPWSGPVKLPEIKAPEVKVETAQPALPELRGDSDEQHGPSYRAPMDRFVGLFAPFRSDRAALSPDGKYVAYNVRSQGTLSVMVVEIDHPQKATAFVTLANDRQATGMLSQNQNEDTPVMVRWMRWTTPTRLVVDVNGSFPVRFKGRWINRTGAIFGMDADGKEARLLASPRDVIEYLPNPDSLRPSDLPGAHMTWSPDQPEPDLSATLPDLADRSSWSNDIAASDPINGPAGLYTPPEIMMSVAKNIQVFDLDPRDPTNVLLLTSGLRRNTGSYTLGFVALNSVNGKTKDLTEDIVPGLTLGLLDRVGHVRIILPATTLAAFPYDYKYLGPTGASRPKPLGRSTGFADLTGFSLSPDNFFGQRAIPLGFDENPDVLYYASNVERDTYGIYSIDLKTGQRGAVRFENPNYDLIPPIVSFDYNRTLVFDRYYHRLAGIRFDATLGTTAWIYPSIHATQKLLEQVLPGRSVEILEWDQSGTRFLVLAAAPGDAGGFYIFDYRTGRLAEFARRAPWIDANQTHKTYAIATKTGDGLPLTGLLTIPNHPRIQPMPVMILCPDMPWLRVQPEFSNRVQALADMGFAVIQYNGRGAWGFGTKFRQALAPGYDQTQVEDCVTMLDHVTRNFPVDANRAAVMGEIHGGFIALRALQLHPEKFRCAVAVNAPVDLAAWLDIQHWSDDNPLSKLTRSSLGDPARLQAAPLVHQPEQITKPILVLHYGGMDGTPRTPVYLGTKAFFASVRSHVPGAEFIDLSTDYVRGLPHARSDTYQEIEGFLNATVYDYKAEAGTPRVRGNQSLRPR